MPTASTSFRIRTDKNDQSSRKQSLGVAQLNADFKQTPFYEDSTIPAPTSLSVRREAKAARKCREAEIAKLERENELMLDRLNAIRERFAKECVRDQGQSIWKSASTDKSLHVKRSFRGVGKESNFYCHSYLSPFKQKPVVPCPPNEPLSPTKPQRRSVARSRSSRSVDTAAPEAVQQSSPNRIRYQSEQPWDQVEVTWRVPSALKQSEETLSSLPIENERAREEEEAHHDFQSALQAWRDTKQSQLSIGEDENKEEMEIGNPLRPSSVWSRNDCGEAPLNLLDGSYDEEAARASFQQALAEWRQEAPVKSETKKKVVFNFDEDSSQTQTISSGRRTLDSMVFFQSKSSLSYFDQLMMQELRKRKEERQHVLKSTLAPGLRLYKAMEKAQQHELSLLSRLNAAYKEGHATTVSRLCQQLLEINTQDATVFHFLLNALLSQSKFSDVLKQLEEWKGPWTVTFSAFKAYALYKLNRIEEALKCVQEHPERHSNSQVMCLEAQIMYRQGNYAASIHVYSQLLKMADPQSTAYAELYNNYLAAKGAWLLSHDVNEIPLVSQKQETVQEQRLDEQTPFEVIYNEAVLSIGRQAYHRALRLLERAEATCLSTLTEEEYSAEEIQEEMAPIIVQKAFILCMLGRSSEAKKIHQALVEQRNLDTGLAAIVSNNWLASEWKANGAVALKESNFLQWTKRTDVESKLLLSQWKLLKRNQALVPITRKKIKALETALHLDPSNTTLQLVYVSSLPLSDALAYLKTTPKVDGETDLGFYWIHVLIRLQKFEDALAVLQPLQEKSVSMLSLKVWLLERTGRLESALPELEKLALQYVDVKLLLAWCYLRLGRYLASIELFTSLLQQEDVLKVRVLSGLTIASSFVDLKQAQTYAQQLKRLLDSDSIQSATPSASLVADLESVSSVIQAWTTTDEFEVSATTKVLKKRRRRKAKLPKVYDPQKQPDPERWLPKRLRSSMKKKRKGKGRMDELTRGPQGIAVSSTTVSTSTEPKPTASSTASSASNQKKKNKKKKGKW